MRKLLILAMLGAAPTAATVVTPQAVAQKPEPMTQAQATDILTKAGYTNITAVSQKGKGNWHAMAVPPTGGAQVAVTVDKKGRIHTGDVDVDD